MGGGGGGKRGGNRGGSHSSGAWQDKDEGWDGSAWDGSGTSQASAWDGSPAAQGPAESGWGFVGGKDDGRGKGVYSSPPGAGKGYYYGPPMQTQPQYYAPAAPTATHTAEAYSKGWSEGHAAGWTAGHAAGYGSGYQAGFQEGQRKRNSQAEAEDEEEEEWPKSKKKPKAQQEEEWREFNERYTKANEESGLMIFQTCLGDEVYEVYPEEIQKELREKYALVESTGASQQMVYEMDSHWAFNIRLFGQQEKDDWDKQLRSVVDKDFVGGQWDRNKAKEDPPAIFEPKIKYRPVLIKKFQ